MIQQTYSIILQFSVTDFVILLILSRININPFHTDFYNKRSFSYYSEGDQDYQKKTDLLNHCIHLQSYLSYFS